MIALDLKRLREDIDTSRDILVSGLSQDAHARAATFMTMARALDGAKALLDRLEKAEEALAEYEPSPEDIAEAEERAAKEEIAIDRLIERAADDAYDAGFLAGRDARNERDF